ncbi:hypothetical protein ACOSQ2_027432 [Xanthoceras sorbifolium]
MAKRSYSILQKKLQELESQLTQAFSLPPETPYRQFYSQEIDQKFLFLNTLLSAEIASSPKKPYNLHHIAQRVADLEIEFREWDSDNVKDSTIVNHFETSSTCSYHNTNHHHVDDHDKDVNAYPELLDEAEEKSVAESTGEAIEKRVWVGKYFVVMASGVLVGMAFMGLVMFRFSGCFHYVNQNSCLMIPT